MAKNVVRLASRQNIIDWLRVSQAPIVRFDSIFAAKTLIQENVVVSRDRGHPQLVIFSSRELRFLGQGRLTPPEELRLFPPSRFARSYHEAGGQRPV